MHAPYHFLIFLSLLLASQLAATAHDGAKAGPPPVKQLQVVGAPLPRAQAYFIGEVHALWEGWAFEFEMMRWASREQGITDVAMEWGKSDAYLFNAYLRDGDTAIYRYYGRDTAVQQQLDRWKMVYDECKITLHGMDFERLVFVSAVMSIIEKTEGGRATKLYAYLQQVQPEVAEIEEDQDGKKQSVRIYEKARKIFSEEKNSLRTLLKTGYTDIAEIMENPATQKRFKHRDEAMADNLLRLSADGKRFICAAGLGHTTLHRNTLTKRLTDAGNSAVIVNMVCRNCYTSSYFGNSVVDMIADYEEKNTEYMKAAFDRLYTPCCYTLIEQNELKELPGGYNALPTYYVLFKDQPQW